MWHLPSQSFHLFKLTDLREMYAAEMIKFLSLGLVGIFIPIYLYTKGVPLTLIIAFLLWSTILQIGAAWLGGSLIPKYGVKHLLGASFILAFAYLLALAAFNQVWVLFAVIAPLYAVAESFHSVAYHYEFSKVKDADHSGQQLSNVTIMVHLAAAIGPFLGGVIGAIYGLQMTLFVCLGLMVLGIGPLFATRDIKPRHKLDMSKISLMKIKNDLISYSGRGLEYVVTLLVWPLFMFLFLGSLVEVGAVTTVALMLTLFASYFIGRLTDRGYRARLIRIGSISNAMANVARMLVTGLGSILAVNIFSDITRAIVRIAWGAQYYSNADRHSRLEYIVAMELAAYSGRVLLFAAMLAASIVASAKAIFIAAFAVTALGMLLVMKIDQKAKRTKIYVGHY
ncbi:MAG TPA: MFS transporter [Candidatus Dormibacteraeota bacterium]|nr:MFS transporter [Candidatus Dormibacteraeota bacterium]